MKRKNALTVLTEAREILKKGWIQGSWFRCDIEPEKPCQACAVGAVIVAAHGHSATTDNHNVPRKVARLLFDALTPKMQEKFRDEFGALESSKHHFYVDSIITFNDRTTTTKKQVLGVFARAIKAATPQA